MKKLVYLFVLTAVFALLCGCAEKEPPVEPGIKGIESVCELATIDCYYNQLAKDVKPRAPGFLIFKEVDREYWVEYTARARIGVDGSKIGFEMQENNITVTIPPAQVLGELYLDKDSYNEHSIVVANDSFFNKNPVTAEDCDKTVNASLRQLKERIEEDKGLLKAAQEDVKELIENYIGQISAATGVEYNVTVTLLDEMPRDKPAEEELQNSAPAQENRDSTSNPSSSTAQ